MESPSGIRSGDEDIGGGQNAEEEGADEGNDAAH